MELNPLAWRAQASVEAKRKLTEMKIPRITKDVKKEMSKREGNMTQRAKHKDS